jgi:hypothetical protein
MGLPPLYTTLATGNDTFRRMCSTMNLSLSNLIPFLTVCVNQDGLSIGEFNLIPSRLWNCPQAVL